MQTTLSIGTMNFGARTPKAEAERIVHRALERGARHFDTANLYSDGEAERILGAALRGERRDRVEIATKVGLWGDEGLGPARVREALEESLERLGTGWVDLYYLHAPDPRTPLEATLEVLQALLEEKKIRAFGLSNFAAWQILDWQHACARRGMAGPARSQVLYNLLVRQLELEYLPFTRAHPIPTTVFNPLAGGLLARPEAPLAGGSRLAKSTLYRRRYGSERFAEQARAYQALAAEAGLSLVTLSYAWLNGRVDSVLAGPATVDHLEAAFEGLKVELGAELRRRIDALHRDFTGTDARYAR